MGLRGPECSICSHAKRAEIEAMLTEQTVAHVASRFRLGVGPLGKHKRQHPRLEATSNVRGITTARSLVAKTGEPPPAPIPKELPAGSSLVDETRAHCRFLQERIIWETKWGDSKVVAALSGQYTSSQKYLGKLTGALEVTQAQIVRHPEFVKVMGVIFEVLEKRKDLETLGALRDTLERIEKGQGK